MSKISIADIQATLAEQNWKLLSDKYINLQTLMDFECPEGHKVYTSWGKLRNKLECPICKSNNIYSPVGVEPKPLNVKRVLALDQATHQTGYAIFDDTKLVVCGVFKTTMEDEIARCWQIKCWLISVIQAFRPDMIAIEGIQYQEEGGGQKMGITVFQTLARLQGILMETCYVQNIPYEVCPTNTWRHACGVKGKTRADRKRSMQLLVKQWYDRTTTDDEADAIGIGRYMATRVEKNTKVENWET